MPAFSPVPSHSLRHLHPSPDLPFPLSPQGHVRSYYRICQSHIILRHTRSRPAPTFGASEAKTHTQARSPASAFFDATPLPIAVSQAHFALAPQHLIQRMNAQQASPARSQISLSICKLLKPTCRRLHHLIPNRQSMIHGAQITDNRQVTKQWVYGSSPCITPPDVKAHGRCSGITIRGIALLGNKSIIFPSRSLNISMFHYQL